jgi:DNA-directed RNA polymerase specialized sigma24 family protein
MSTEPGTASVTADAAFELFFAEVEPRLRLALTASYGFEAGREATAEAFAWAWEHRDRLETIEHPVPYLYRVGQSRTRRRKLRVLHVRSDWTEPRVEPGLMNALRKLTERQRIAVVLVHGYGWTLAEVAQLLDIKVTTVQTHLERGLARLRVHLEVTPDA